MWQLPIRKWLLAAIILCFWGILLPENVAGSEFTDAYEFYQKHGSEMVFEPIRGTPDGMIYYGTIAKQASGSRILYRTLGWKVTVRNQAGVVLDELYYRIGGSYMKQVDECYVDGYEYDIYSLSLLDIRNHLTPQALESLKIADCSITFDACTTVMIDGVPQGTMTDEGILTGEVYTDYEGISTAQNWSKKTKETLKSYFNKVVPDLFCTVSLSCGTGIAEVNGGGKYLYGTEISIEAIPQRGYTFMHWYGTRNSPSEKLTFMVDGNVYMTAYGEELEMMVYLYRNLTLEDTKREYRSYLYTDAQFPMKAVNWEKTGYHQLGWSTDREAKIPLFGVTQELSLEWLEATAPAANLYAVWEPNRYTIVFDGRGAEGVIAPMEVTYTDLMQLPDEGFLKEGERMLGWSLSPDGNSMDFESGGTIEVAEFVNQVNLADVDDATITLYAVWDAAPQISGNDIYVTLRQIAKGVVSEKWLSGYMKATDIEDGAIVYGKNEKNAFYILDYSPEEFHCFTKAGYLTQTFCAIDSAGNETTKTIRVHIVDESAPRTMQALGIRFISRTYYKNAQGEWTDESEGGLLENSIWRLKEEYRSILDELFIED